MKKLYLICDGYTDEVLPAFLKDWGGEKVTVVPLRADLEGFQCPELAPETPVVFAPGKPDAVSTPDGEKQLALVSFGGFLLELIQSPVPVPMGEGNIPHFAVYVDDVDAAAAAIQAAGVDTFLKPEKTVLPKTFGGLENRFFQRAAGEQIELLHML